MKNPFNLSFLLLFTVFSIGSVKAQASLDGTHEEWEYALEGTGDILQIGIPVTAGIVSLLEKDYEGTKQLALSYGTTMAITYTLKHLIKSRRPEGRNRYDSFPSGHTSSAFSGAAFIQKRYGWKYGWIAYFLASIVGVSRMEGPDGYHNFWDIVGGATVGIGSSYLYTTSYAKETVQIGFSSGNKSYLFSIYYSF
ncbi:PAP2 superfamily protein [Ulvibacter sp. MAR_2010_11]|uniref:phosphatase PAP2 family protein n=1 Tax=Ulvibacter sp. MAR_2010_11 TaxID=1250229 RepID=UPI000C2CD524|nr:phosphatase PAP2 family protein [Ulvibacter sp. MAR_2010_11]PKA84575.1 PAP2 superfamily protein [Ulvibacter sp. MAR_2010_11]